jgi:hypothetical protein
MVFFPFVLIYNVCVYELKSMIKLCYKRILLGLSCKKLTYNNKRQSNYIIMITIILSISFQRRLLTQFENTDENGL